MAEIKCEREGLSNEESSVAEQSESAAAAAAALGRFHQSLSGLSQTPTAHTHTTWQMFAFRAVFVHTVPQSAPLSLSSIDSSAATQSVTQSGHR